MNHKKTFKTILLSSFGKINKITFGTEGKDTFLQKYHSNEVFQSLLEAPMAEILY